jgi:UDP-N-acetyl-D-glucosamine dehydrogenase
VLIIGLAYKPDIDDVRETPAAEIITLLGEMGAEISYHDPHVARFPRMRKYHHDLASVALTPAALKAADCVVIVTNHSAVDYTLLGQHARLIVDTRNAMARVPSPKARIVRA